MGCDNGPKRKWWQRWRITCVGLQGRTYWGTVPFRKIWWWRYVFSMPVRYSMTPCPRSLDPRPVKTSLKLKKHFVAGTSAKAALMRLLEFTSASWTVGFSHCTRLHEISRNAFPHQFSMDLYRVETHWHHFCGINPCIFDDLCAILKNQHIYLFYLLFVRLRKCHYMLHPVLATSTHLDFNPPPWDSAIQPFGHLTITEKSACRAGHQSPWEGVPRMFLHVPTWTVESASVRHNTYKRTPNSINLSQFQEKTVGIWPLLTFWKRENWLWNIKS